MDILKIAVDAAKNKGISTIAVASTTGETALKLFELTKNETLKIIVVTHSEGKSVTEKKFSDEVRKKLSTGNVTIYTPRARSHILRKMMGRVIDYLGLPSWHKHLREIKERFGAGMRVCHLIARILIKEGLLKEDRVIAIAGTKRGADSATLFKVNAKHPWPILEEIIVRPRQEGS